MSSYNKSYEIIQAGQNAKNRAESAIESARDAASVDTYSLEEMISEGVGAFASAVESYFEDSLQTVRDELDYAEQELGELCDLEDQIRDMGERLDELEDMGKSLDYHGSRPCDPAAKEYKDSARPVTITGDGYELVIIPYRESFSLYVRGCNEDHFDEKQADFYTGVRVKADSVDQVTVPEEQIEEEVKGEDNAES